MTAGDNMIYRINVSAKDAQGRPFKGIGQSASCAVEALRKFQDLPLCNAQKFL